jgi:hypothetical protein
MATSLSGKLKLPFVSSEDLIVWAAKIIKTIKAKFLKNFLLCFNIFVCSFKLI